MDIRTRQEIQSLAGIFDNAFGKLKLGDLKTDMLVTWIEGYETQPGKLAMPRTRAKLKTKLSQFLNFAERKEWIEKKPSGQDQV